MRDDESRRLSSIGDDTAAVAVPAGSQPADSETRRQRRRRPSRAGAATVTVQLPPSLSRPWPFRGRNSWRRGAPAVGATSGALSDTAAGACGGGGICVVGVGAGPVPSQRSAKGPGLPALRAGPGREETSLPFGPTSRPADMQHPRRPQTAVRSCSSPRQAVTHGVADRWGCSGGLCPLRATPLSAQPFHSLGQWSRPKLH